MEVLTVKGKEKCRILKEIRSKIAEENNIEYITSQCSHKGDCSGTCPKCEAEVKYLENELEKRRLAGKRIAVAGVAAAVMLSSAGCDTDNNGGDEMLDGDVLMPESSQSVVDTAVMGEVTEELVFGNMEKYETDEETEFEELDGDIYYPAEADE